MHSSAQSYRLCTFDVEQGLQIRHPELSQEKHETFEAMVKFHTLLAEAWEVFCIQLYPHYGVFRLVKKFPSKYR